MRTRLVLVVVAACLALASAIEHAFATVRTTAINEAAPHTREAEVARIRLHFDSVLTELHGRDVASLTPASRERRLTLLGTLRDYRDAGVFPSNYDFPGEAIPYFVDRKTGTLCAVAHLMASTGRADIVDRVARADNNVWVAALAGDAEFEAWLDEHGLTLDEAARIQVPYAPVDEPAAPSRSANVTAPSAVALGGAVAATLWNGFANRSGDSRLGNIAGIAAGAVALGAGASSMGERSNTSLGAASAVAGAASILLSTRGILRHRQEIAHQRTASAQREAPRATVSPMIPVDGSGGGLSLTVRF